MKILRIRTYAVIALAISLLVGVTHGLMAGLSVYCVANCLALTFAPAPISHTFGVTLTTPQLMLDVYTAFRKFFPAFSSLGTEWRASPLKLNQKYTAHIASYGSASTYDSSTGYANGANTARNGLVDVNVVVNQHPTYPLKWLHLDEIKDQKNRYEEVMQGAGYVLGKAAFDNGIAAKMTSRYFSQEVVTSVANCDYDWLMEIGTKMNQNGCLPIGRVLIVNSDVAAVLAVDARLISKDYAGQLLDGNGYRQWRNVGGFALIQEYPDLSANNGSALTSVTAEADDDLITKAAHGLETGDPFVISAMTGGTGLTTATRYWAIKVSSSTFKAASTRANALAGTAIDITVDGSAMTVTKTENLRAFACDRRAFSLLAGVPDGFTSQLAAQLGINPTINFESGPIDPMSGITMGVAKWMESGTGNLFWCPTFVYGTNAGKEGDTAVASNTAEANSILAAANANGTACDYAGVRCSSGAT
jgi:hypothetical protein